MYDSDLTIKILYIEDSQVVASLVQKQLKPHGYKIEHVKEGDKGLAKLKENEYDMVIVDYQLPGMDGLQVLRTLTESSLQVPTIMITGAGDEQVAVEAMKLGVGDYLVKDDNYLKQLPSVINCVLKRHKIFIEKSQTKRALHDRDAILEAVSFAAEKFLTTTHWEQPIQEVLARLGQAAKASRAYIFKNHHNRVLPNSSQSLPVPSTSDLLKMEKTGTKNLLCSQCHEWVAEGISSQINNPNRRNLPYHPHFSRWAKKLAQGRSIHGFVKNFPKPEATLLAAQEILSLALTPIFVGQSWWGFIGYDDCLEERTWSAVVVEAFKTAARLLGAAIEREQMDQALRQSEEQVQTFIKTADDMIWFRALDGSPRPLNSSHARITGYSLEEFETRPTLWREIMHPEDLRKLQAFLAAHPQGAPVFDLEYRLRTKDNQWRWIHTHMVGSQDEAGRYRGYNCICRDVTERKRTEEALTRTLSEQEIILNNSLVGIAFLGHHRQILRANKKLADIFGYKEEELKGHTTAKFYPTYQDYERLGQAAYPQLSRGETYETECLMRRRDGELFWCRLQGKAIESHDLSQGSLWHVEDITEQRRAQENLRLAAVVFETTTEAILVTDADNNMVAVNPAFATITGYAQEDALGKNPSLLSSGHHDSDFYQEMWESLNQTGKWQGEIWNRRKNDEVYTEWLSITVLQDAEGKIKQHIGIFSDITKRKQAEALICHQAHYDALTDLPNRTLFMDRLAHELQRTLHQKTYLALMFIDLDHFKWVNDTLGHNAGDQLLQEIAKRLQACVCNTDTVARLGGDEFTIILPKIDNLRYVEVVAKRCLEQLTKPLIIENKKFNISGSIGITLCPKDGQDVESLLKSADFAMYQAKESGRNNFCFFTPEMFKQQRFTKTEPVLPREVRSTA